MEDREIAKKRMEEMQDEIALMIPKYRIVKLLYREKTIFKLQELEIKKEYTPFGRERIIENWVDKLNTKISTCLEQVYDFNSVEKAEEELKTLIESKLNRIVLDVKEYSVNISIEPLVIQTKEI